MKVSPEKTSSKTTSLSRRRLWLFRLCALTLVPLLLLGALEGGLRLAGVGYPTSFFLREHTAQGDVLVTNDRFGFRFFPPALARTPFSLRIPAVKPAGTFRIFLFGESAAQGDPDPTFGMGRYLEALLRERYPGTRFEVVCVAMTAINSHAILPIAQECARLDGDLWVIYMGNNEMVGPFGAGTVFGPQAPRLSLIRAHLAARASKTGQLMEQMVEGMAAKKTDQKAWGGMRMFKDHQLRHDDPARLRAYENFAGNLEDILRAGAGKGVPVVLSTVAVNLGDCAPFASQHKAVMGEADLNAWNGFYQQGIEAGKQGDQRAALAAYRQAAALDPEFAELQYRIGQCSLALGQRAEAKRAFGLALNYDALAFRADDHINRIIREAADRHANRGVKLVDAVAGLETNAPAGILGEDLFYEHVHLTFEGNYRVARLLAEEVAKALPETARAGARGEWASAERCDDRLGVSLWDRQRVWQANFSRVSEPPFTEQSNDVPRAKRYMARLEHFAKEMTPEAQVVARARYEQAVAAAPDDASLVGNYAQFLSQVGDLAAAVKQQERVGQLLPQAPGSFHKLGLLLVRDGKTTEAREQFTHALALRPDYVPALNELGLILALQQKTAEATACFTNAIRLNSGYVESYLNLGFLDQNAGNLPAALVQYGRAAELQPEGPAAHFNRAMTLAAQRKRDEALPFFQAVVWMNPGFWHARYLLGIELATAGKEAEAEAQFAQVVRLRPDFMKGHMNLGVALAKRRKLDEAAREFGVVLQLNPTNELAKRHLETIRALQSRGM